MNILKKNKYLKYSKKGQYNGKKIKSMGLAVFVNYEKELSKLTKDIYLKKFLLLLGVGNIHTKIKWILQDGKQFKMLCTCKKRKLKYTDGECIVVDFRRITGDSQYPVTWENHLFKREKIEF